MEQLKKARIALGLKQNEVARSANISTSYYNEIEKGKKKPSYEVMKRIAIVLRSDPTTLFYASEFAYSE